MDLLAKTAGQMFLFTIPLFKVKDTALFRRVMQ